MRTEGVLGLAGCRLCSFLPGLVWPNSAAEREFDCTSLLLASIPETRTRRQHDGEMKKSASGQRIPGVCCIVLDVGSGWATCFAVAALGQATAQYGQEHFLCRCNRSMQPVLVARS